MEQLQLRCSKIFSNGGCEILVKSVAQSVPTYTISVFRLPHALCEDLRSMVTNFWWGGDGVERRLHLWSGDKLCRKKEDGGFGFRDITAFNKALVAK